MKTHSPFVKTSTCNQSVAAIEAAKQQQQQQVMATAIITMAYSNGWGILLYIL